MYMEGGSVLERSGVVAQCSMFIGGYVDIKIKRGPLSVCALIAKVYTHECCWCTEHTSRMASMCSVYWISHSRKLHMPRETQIFNTWAEQMP